MKNRTNTPAAPQAADQRPNQTPEQAAAFLGVSPYTLNGWRTTKRVPLPYVKVGRLVRYRMSDLEAFIASNTVSDL